MGWYIALGIIALLAILPLGVSVRYDEDGALVKLIVGPLKITLFPRPKKKKKPEKRKQKETKPVEQKAEPAAPQAPKQAAPQKPVQPKEPPKYAAEPKPEPKKKKSGGKLTDFLPLVKTALDFLGNFRRKLRVNLLELKLVMASDDPCDLAVNYGRAWAAVGNLMPRLERFLTIKKRNVEVECDFTADETRIFARLELTITLGRLLAAAFVFAFHAIVELLKIMKKRKGGAVNESKSS